MKKFLFYFAVTGWILGLTVHLLSFADFDVSEKIPFVWILHLGIFVVWIPTILKLKKNKELNEYQKSGFFNRINPIAFSKILFRNTPNWLTAIALWSFLYAIINFMMFMSSQVGAPDIKDGQFILQNHGQLIKTITEQEYFHYKANEMKGFSGHWLVFYGFAMAVLFPFNQQSKNVNEN